MKSGKVKNILVAGRPGVGKTTLIKKLAEKLSGEVAGFYTEEIRKAGVRVGFKIRSFAGREGILAHVDIKSDKRVGKYRVNLEDLEKVGVDSILGGLEKANFILIDEIGKMEMYSERFKEVVIKVLDSNKFLIATIIGKSHSFADKIKKREDIKLFEITRVNRDDLFQDILAFCL
jgi:nucleoside-triphosphatase